MGPACQVRVKEKEKEKEKGTKATGLKADQASSIWPKKRRLGLTGWLKRRLAGRLGMRLGEKADPGEKGLAWAWLVGPKEARTFLGLSLSSQLSLSLSLVSGAGLSARPYV